jgi:hypothetical protein
MIPQGMQLIGIVGHARSGKDTIANYLHHSYKNVWTEAFADPLKSACAAAFGIPLEDFYDDAAKETVNDFWEVSPRQIAQFVGTEMFRDRVHQLIPGTVSGEFWIKRMIAKLSGLDDSCYDAEDTVIIPDVRFKNEYDFITSQGGIILHLTRPGADGNIGIPGHASEKPFFMDVLEQTFSIFNTGPLDDLYAKVDDVIRASSLQLHRRSS